MIPCHGPSGLRPLNHTRTGHSGSLTGVVCSRIQTVQLSLVSPPLSYRILMRLKHTDRYPKEADRDWVKVSHLAAESRIPPSEHTTNAAQKHIYFYTLFE
ncbi:hypothetical protein HanRHA438_Chr04g0186561 [Helianthus annuus]|nr:hypothetical protein HanRHA438_Chr04g0186561 [Helianthus annuus]